MCASIFGKDLGFCGFCKLVGSFAFFVEGKLVASDFHDFSCSAYASSIFGRKDFDFAFLGVCNKFTSDVHVFLVLAYASDRDRHG